MSRRVPPFEPRKKYSNPEYAELEKTQNEIREAKIEASKKAYNALNPEKREKVDEIYNQYNLDWKKLGFTNADKKKEQALRKLFKKKWWKLWIDIPDFERGMLMYKQEQLKAEIKKNGTI
jgi:hypothetical protein